MGSLEEEKLFEMVDDYIESYSSPPLLYPSSLNPSHYQSITSFLQEVLKSLTAVENQVTEDVLKYMRHSKSMVANTTSSSKEWLVRRLQLDGYNASLCHTSWVTTTDCPAGEYEYIGVTPNSRDMMNGDGSKTRLIVDIDFKSQFEVARPTAAYMKLLGSVPILFVGDSHKLNKVITLLCSAAKQSFRDNNIYIPPWRTITFMQSKYKTSLDNTTGSATTTKTRTNWEPPKVKARNIGTKGPSGLSCQFSTNFSTRCC
ncbi:hypothetical protein AgCh_008481 [Apium graveolens]